MTTLTEAQKEAKAQSFIESEMKRRFDLINDPEFVKICIATVKRLGMTAKEWNKEKGMLLMMFANEACGIENKIERESAKV